MSAISILSIGHDELRRPFPVSHLYPRLDLSALTAILSCNDAEDMARRVSSPSPA